MRNLLVTSSLLLSFCSCATSNDANLEKAINDPAAAKLARPTQAQYA